VTVGAFNDGAAGALSSRWLGQPDTIAAIIAIPMQVEKDAKKVFLTFVLAMIRFRFIK